MERTTIGAFTDAHDDSEGWYMPVWSLTAETAERTRARYGEGAMIVAAERLTESGWPFIALEDPKGRPLVNFYPHGTFGTPTPPHLVALTRDELRLTRAGVDALGDYGLVLPEDEGTFRLLCSKLVREGSGIDT